jgi:hypothetical protein
MKYKIWDKKSNLITPVAEVFTPEQIFAKYPAAKFLEYIIADAPVNMSVFMEFTQTKDVYKNMGALITDTMTKEEVLNAITAFETKPQDTSPSVEERTAAALEFLALNSLPE